jgi:hypothetical protein
MGMLGSGVAPRVATFGASGEQLAAASNITIPGLAIGPASADRRVVASIGARNTNNASLNSVTIGGVPATVIATINALNNNSQYIAIALVPTGLTADVNMVWSANIQRVGVGVWSLTGALSNIPVDTQTAQSNTPNVNVNVGLNGCVIAGLFNGAGSTANWTGVTEDYDVDFSSTNKYTGGHQNALAAGARTVSVALGNPSTPCLAAVSF